MDKSTTRAPVYSLWLHKRTRRIVMADKNRVTVDGMRQVRIKYEGRARWVGLDYLTENYDILQE